MGKINNCFRRLITMFVIFSMVITSFRIPTFAEGGDSSTVSVWEKVDVNSITADDVVTITMTTKNGTIYVLPNAQATNACPTAAKGSIVDEKLNISTGAYTDYSWSISNDGAGNLTIKNASGDYLLTNAANDGVRIKTSSTVPTWKVDANGYLSIVDSKGATRYLGIYEAKPDWRAYTNTTGNTANQTLGFYKYVETIESGTGGEETDIEKLTVTEAHEGTLTAGTVLTFQVGTITDATYEVSSNNTDFIAITGNTYTIPDGEPGDYKLYVRAVKDGKYSQVLTVDYTIEDTTAEDEVVTIAAARALAIGTNATVEGVVTFIDGKNIYVEDSTAAIDLYFITAPTDIKVGDVVKAKGARATYNGLEELSSVTEYTITGTRELPSKKVTIADLLGDTERNIYECQRVYIENVVLGDIVNTGNTTVTDADGNTMNIYKLVADATAAYQPAKGDKVNLYAVVGEFKAYQLRLSVNDLTLVEAGTKTLADAEVTATPSENLVVGTEVTFSVDGFDDVTFEISSDGVTFTPITGNKYTIIANESGLNKLYVRATDGTLTSKVLELTFLLDAGTGSGSEELPEIIADGTYVIWAPEYGWSVADLKNSSGYYIGDKVTGDMKQVTGYTKASLWDVKYNADTKTYTISQGSNFLGSTSAGKFTIEAAPANKDWTISIDADKAHYNLWVNGKVLEWYTNYSDWSLDTKIRTGNEKMYQLWLTPAANVYDKDTSVINGIAAWGGIGSYDASATSVNGDKYKSGDQLDANAHYTAIISGKPVKPYTDGKDVQYMGAAGFGSGTNDYAQLDFSTAGYGNLEMQFRLRSSAKSSGEYQLQYSTNGTDFTNLKNGTYECKYTRFNTDGTTEPVELKGEITDGICKTSIKDSTYITFGFALPADAENAETLYIRLVPSTTKLANKTDGTPTTGGTFRMDNVMVVGSPIVDDSITGYVTADPDGKEDVAAGTEITLTTKTENATILYRFVKDGSEAWLTYDANNKPALPTDLPAVLETKATCAGKADSIVSTYEYAAGTVANITVTPTGSGIYIANDTDVVNIELACATEGAVIYYNMGEVDADGVYAYQVYDPATAPITVTKGFKTITVRAYGAKDGFTNSPVSTFTFNERSQESYNIYFGQIHSHTSYSDGAGTCEDAFKHATNVENLDFLAVTDHSNSLDGAADSVLANDASTISTEWKEGKELAKKYTTDTFVGLFGYEMTWSNGLGHINTFNTPGFQSRTQSDYSSYSSALQNYYAALKTVPGSISQFNHPGTTFGDFSDFAYYDEEIDKLITLVEVGNGEGTVGSSSYFPSYEYYTRALDKGWHVAPTNNQDNHKGLWGDANTTRTVVLADSLTEADIYDAMKNYRVYATEDNDLSIYYTLNNNVMGTILTKEAVGDSLTLKVNLKDPTDAAIGTVEVIVNGGLSIAKKTVDSNEGEVTFTVGADYSYYYIKVVQKDGDIAVTAPVWVGEVEACGISSFETSSALQIQNESIDLKVTLYNNEKTPLDVNKIEFSVLNTNDEETVIKTVEGADLTNANIAQVAKMSTADYSMDYTYIGLGKAIYTVTVYGTLNGVDKVYSEKLELNYVSKEMVSIVVVDGTHYNDYVTGYYGGNMSNFTALAADEAVKVIIAGGDKAAADRSLTEAEWKELLAEAKLLVVSAPARNSGTANAGDYHASEFEDWYLDLVSEFVKNGGNVVVCGLADYQDTKAGAATNHTSAQLNKLLKAAGSSMTLNDDEAYDKVNNGGQEYRLYPENYNTTDEISAMWLEGLVSKDASPDNYQKYSQYSGCTVSKGNGTPIVSGFDTTYSIDSDKDGVGNNGENDGTNNIVVAKGDVDFLVVEKPNEASGYIFAAGGVFLSDFEVSYELDNAFDLPRANTTIAKNLLNAVKSELPVTDITEVREAANDTANYGNVYRVQGVVTAGRNVEGNAFFDCIYIQDETGGIDIFPISDDTIKLGDVVEVVGYIAEYQGDIELKVMSYKVVDSGDVVDPTLLPCLEASDYKKNGGLLTAVTGKVKAGSMYYNSDGTLAQFVVEDGTGETKIFIDGYIVSGSKGNNTLTNYITEGANVTAVGVQYMHPEVLVPGETGNVSVLRVRNCDEILLVEDQSFDKANPADVAFEVSGQLGQFVTVTLDGKELSQNDYTLTEGSTIVTLPADKVAKYAEGEHKLEFTFKVSDSQEKISATLTIDDTTSPADPTPVTPVAPTGDTLFQVAMAVMGVSAVALIAVVVLKKKKENK